MAMRMFVRPCSRLQCHPPEALTCPQCCCQCQICCGKQRTRASRLKQNESTLQVPNKIRCTCHFCVFACKQNLALLSDFGTWVPGDMKLNCCQHCCLFHSCKNSCLNSKHFPGSNVTGNTPPRVPTGNSVQSRPGDGSFGRGFACVCLAISSL